jgi:hypothetical protein
LYSSVFTSALRVSLRNVSRRFPAWRVRRPRCRDARRVFQ